MKVFLLIYLIANGVDLGPPAIEMPSMDECKINAQELMARPIPDGIDIVRVGCVEEKNKSSESPA